MFLCTYTGYFRYISLRLVNFVSGFCRLCRCLRADRVLDCLHSVRPHPSLVNDHYLRVEMHGNVADCAGLQVNFPDAKIEDCIQSGTSSGGGGGGGGGGFDPNNFYAFLSFLVFVLPVIWALVKKFRGWRAARAAAAAAASESAPEAVGMEEEEEEQEALPSPDIPLSIMPRSTETPLEPERLYDLLM